MLGGHSGQRLRRLLDSFLAEASQETLDWMKRMEAAAKRRSNTSFAE